MTALRTMGLLYLRNLRQVPRIPTVLVFGIAMPVIQLLLFGSLFQGMSETGGFERSFPDISYRAYIAPAIITLTAFLGMANASAALTVDLRTGYFDKLRTTPARPIHIIVARLGAEMTRVAMQATLILGISLLFPSTRVETGVLGALAMIGLVVLFSACTAGLIVTALALKTKSDQATQSTFPLFFVAIMLSSAYVPKASMEGWLQAIVDANPVEYLIRAVRGLMVSGWQVGDILVTLGVSAVAAVLLVALNLRIYRRSIGG